MLQCKKTRWVPALIFCSLLSACESSEEDEKKGSTTTPDKPVVVEISLDKVHKISEPDIGKTAYAEVTLRLKSALSYDLTLSASTLDITASSTGAFKNYTSLIANEIVIPAGSKQINIPINVFRNELFEGDKTLNLTITLPDSNDYTIDNDKATITIRDVDNEPELNLVKPDEIIVEGDTAYLTFKLSHYTSKDVTARIAISGLATLVDYTTDLTNNIITIPALSISAQLKLDVMQDHLPEGGESLIFDVISVNNAELGDNKSAMILIPGSYGLDDTGVSTYFDGVNFDASAPQSQYPNQDASYGLDTLNPANEQENGAQGFFFTKLDDHGNILPHNATSWSCVKDERTGLYIEVKQPVQDKITLTDQKLIQFFKDYIKLLKEDMYAPYLYENNHKAWRSASYLYTWYYANSDESGGSKGARNDQLYSNKYPLSQDCAYRQDEPYSDYCNTDSYLENMNGYALCGFIDWKLPSVSQARSIINYSSIVELGTTEFFPHSKAPGAARTILTQSTSVNNNASAWCVDMPTGRVELCHKGSSTGIIAVRGGIN